MRRCFSMTRSVMSKVELFYSSESTNLRLANNGNHNVSLINYVKETCPSLAGPKAVYKPTPFLFNGHLQTAYAAYSNSAPTTKPVKYER